MGYARRELRKAEKCQAMAERAEAERLEKGNEEQLRDEAIKKAKEAEAKAKSGSKSKPRSQGPKA